MTTPPPEVRRKSERVSFLVFLAILLVLFAQMMRAFWIPAGLAAVTVVLCSPIYSWMLARCRGRAYPAAGLSVLALATFVLLPLGGLVSIILTQVIRFSQGLVEQLQSGQLSGALDELTTWITGVVVRLDNLVPGDLTGFDASQIDIKGPLISAGSQIGATLARFAPQAIASTANVGLSVTIWLLFVFVLFVEGKRLFEFVMVISPLASAHELAIAQEVREMIVANFVAIAATAALNGVLLGGIFWASPLEPAGLWAVVAFGMSFVPALGAAAVWITGALYLLATGHSGWALGITIFGLVVIAQTDNVVKPLLMRGRVNIHPLLLMLSLLGGATAMGPAGLVFGPVFVAVLQAALRIYKREFAVPI